jgi:hypothetical protein
MIDIFNKNAAKSVIVLGAICLLPFSQAVGQEMDQKDEPPCFPELSEQLVSNPVDPVVVGSSSAGASKNFVREAVIQIHDYLIYQSKMAPLPGLRKELDPDRTERNLERVISNLSSLGIDPNLPSGVGVSFNTEDQTIFFNPKESEQVVAKRLQALMRSLANNNNYIFGQTIAMNYAKVAEEIAIVPRKYPKDGVYTQDCDTEDLPEMYTRLGF